MADSLLNKNKSTGKRNLLDRKESVKPKEAFDRSSLFTVDESKKNDSTPSKEVVTKKQKGKTTTIRCSTDTSHRLNAIVTSFSLDSVNELLDILLDDYEASLTADERREIKTLLAVYRRKSGK
ncbi:MAG: hypothetical protein KC455_09060 [Carnobacterium sp.]|nr:hypothetical protein [Carnobacterium sp.]